MSEEKTIVSTPEDYQRFFLSDDFARLSQQIQATEEAKLKQQELADESFRSWLLNIIMQKAEEWGYVFTSAKVFVQDAAWAFGEGYKRGAERAHMESFRNAHGGGNG